MKKNHLYKNNISRYILPSIISIGLFQSCTKDFDKLNTNPYQPTDEMLNYDNVKIGGFFTQLEKNIKPIGTAAESTGPANNYQIAFNLSSDNWAGYMSPGENKFNNGSNFTTYYFITNWNDGTFNTLFTSVFNPYIQLKSNIDSTKNPELLALADIVKISGIHQATDMYGPIPYAGVGSGALTNPYQSQQTVYNTFFTELTNAINVLTQYSATNSTILPDYDAVYNGNVTKWIQYANSLMLRLAMRIVYADPTTAQKYAEQAVNNSFGVITDTKNGAQLSAGAGLTFVNPITILWQDYKDTRFGASLLSYLLGYNDPRLAAYCSQATVNGVTNYYGVRTGTPDIDYTSLSAPNIPNTQPMYWMKASEVSFLRAEGAAREWNMGGSAASFYTQGINNSFIENGVTSASYINDNTSKPAGYTNPLTPSENSAAVGTITIAWDESANLETKLEKIITQKWIAIFPNGQEAWSEYRRTGYPKLFPVLVNTSGGTVSTSLGVQRMAYPPSEYSTNAANVNAAVANLLGGADNGGTKVWWDKK